MIDHKFYYCICQYYHLVFVIIIKLFRRKSFDFVSVTNLQMIFFQFLNSDFFMVVKVEVKYKVIFQSKHKCHSSQIEVKHVLSTGILFFWILPDVLFFLEKKTFGIFVVEICVKRYEVEVGMAARCRCCRFIYDRILSLL